MRCGLMLVGALAGAAGVGCFPGLDYPVASRVACTTSADCPTGLQCSVAGFCVSEADAVPPRLVSAQATSSVSVEVLFDEPLGGSSAGDPASFTLEPALAVTGAIVLEPQRILLTTAPQSAGQSYDVTSTAADLEGNRASALISVPFVGYGQPADPTAPTPLAPQAYELVAMPLVNLRWSPRRGAATYRVDVALDAEFATPLPGSPFTNLTATTLPLTVSEPRTHYWRVSADVTEETLPISRFDVIGDDVFVHCPQSVDCQNPDSGLYPLPRSGNASRPLFSVAAAVALARTLGLERVLIAGRGGGETYRDVILTGGTPGAILGGYDSTFSEASRDAVANPTIVEGEAPVLTLTGGTLPVLLSGLTVRAGNPSLAVISTIGADANVVIEDVRIEVSSPIGAGVGLSLAASVGLGPVVEDLEIDMTLLGGEGKGIGISGGPAQISNTSINISGVGGAIGIQVANAGGVVTFSQSSITVDVSGDSVTGVHVTTNGRESSGAEVALSDSTVAVSGDSTAWGLQVSGSDSPTTSFTNVTLSATGGGWTSGVELFDPAAVLELSGGSVTAEGTADAPSVDALRAEAGGTLVVVGTTLTARRPSGAASAALIHGMRLSQQVDVTLTDTTLVAAGNGGEDVVGVRLGNIAGLESRLTIAKSRLSASGGENNRVFVLTDEASAKVTNSVVIAGAAATVSHGVELACTSNLGRCREITLTNNVILAGATSAPSVDADEASAAIYVVDGAPLVTNNVLGVIGGAGSCFAESESSLDARPAPTTFLANGLFGCPVWYRRNTDPQAFPLVIDEITSLTPLHALDGASVGGSWTCTTTSGPLVMEVSANVHSDKTVTELFADPGGTDNLLHTFDGEDFRLQRLSSPDDFWQMGVVTSGNGCGTCAARQSCGGVVDDAASANRSPPYSLGAYEVN